MNNQKCFPKRWWFFKKFQVTILAENTDTQHTDSQSRKHGSSRFHAAGVPLQSCFCAVSKRVLWTGQGAGGACTPSVIVDGSIKDDPDDLERRQAMFIGHQGRHRPLFHKTKMSDKNLCTLGFLGATQCIIGGGVLNFTEAIANRAQDTHLCSQRDLWQSSPLAKHQEWSYSHDQHS